MHTDLKYRLAAILAELEGLLPCQDITEAQECIYHNEFGIALEIICTQIIEHELKITQKLYAKIQSTTDQMKLDKNLYMQIKIDYSLK